jgi:DNA excision repair protein ERCC-4
MTSSTTTSTLLSEYLSALSDKEPKGKQGRRLMERKLKLYLWWKSKLSERKKEGRNGFAMPARGKDFEAEAEKRKDKDLQVSKALQRKDKEIADRGAKRRRLRGGAPTAAASSSRGKSVVPGEQVPATEGEMLNEAEEIADLYANIGLNSYWKRSNRYSTA